LKSRNIGTPDVRRAILTHLRMRAAAFICETCKFYKKTVDKVFQCVKICKSYL